VQQLGSENQNIIVFQRLRLGRFLLIFGYDQINGGTQLIWWLVTIMIRFQFFSVVTCAVGRRNIRSPTLMAQTTSAGSIYRKFSYRIAGILMPKSFSVWSQLYGVYKDSKKLQESNGFIKRQKSFQELAIYGHEVLMSLQTRVKFLGTHSTTSVLMSVTKYFNTTWYLLSQVFLNVFTMKSELAVHNCCVLLINHKAVLNCRICIVA
jgi:hypothetical protein